MLKILLKIKLFRPFWFLFCWCGLNVHGLTELLQAQWKVSSFRCSLNRAKTLRPVMGQEGGFSLLWDWKSILFVVHKIDKSLLFIPFTPSCGSSAVWPEGSRLQKKVSNFAVIPIVLLLFPEPSLREPLEWSSSSWRGEE